MAHCDHDKGPLLENNIFSDCMESGEHFGTNFTMVDQTLVCWGPNLQYLPPQIENSSVLREWP